MKVIIHTTRKPWLDGVKLAKGQIVEIEDEAVAKLFIDNDFALQLPEEPKPAPAPKGK